MRRRSAKGEIAARARVILEDGTPVADLHGLTTWNAMTWAGEVIKSAYQHGCSEVVFVHGARGIERSWQSIDGYGSTKLALRAAVRRGDFPEAYKRSRREVRGATRLVVPLRPNANPSSDSPWPDGPELDYDSVPFHERRDFGAWLKR